jgi:hypothetical protein
MDKFENHGYRKKHLNPFAQLVSPQPLAEAIAASVQLQRLPGYAYRPLEKEHGPRRKQPLPLHPDPLGSEVDEDPPQS